MIKPGRHQTIGGYTATVIESSENGAIGWIKNGMDWFPRAWFNDGSAYGNFSRQGKFDLVLPRTIKIPEIELPEPMRVYEPKVYPVFENADTVISLKIRLKNPAAADQWVAFLKDTVCRDKE